MTEVVILNESHIEEVALIEELCFFEPWSESSLGMLTEGNGFGLVAVCDGLVCGYVGVVAVPPEGEITNVAVHPDFRRRGIGRMLLTELKKEAFRRGIDSLYLEVRESNEGARRLYSSMGFFEVGRRSGFYRHPVEDGLLMRTDIK